MAAKNALKQRVRIAGLVAHFVLLTFAMLAAGCSVSKDTSRAKPKSSREPELQSKLKAAEFALRADKPQEAIRLLEKEPRIGSISYITDLTLGRAYARNNQPLQAITSYNSFMTVGRLAPSDCWEYARMMKREGNLAAAKSAYQAILNGSPFIKGPQATLGPSSVLSRAQEYYVRLSLANSFMMEGYRSQVIPHLNYLVQTNVGGTEAKRQVVDLCIELGNLYAARQVLRSIISGPATAREKESAKTLLSDLGGCSKPRRLVELPPSKGFPLSPAEKERIRKLILQEQYNFKH